MTDVDKVIKCRDCGSEFTFTAGEQAFYRERGFQHEPTRCRNCRGERKRHQPAGGGEAQRAGSGSRELFDAVCTSCGVTTQVPFRPTPGKPVYCRECFQSSKAARGM